MTYQSATGAARSASTAGGTATLALDARPAASPANPAPDTE